MSWLVDFANLISNEWVIIGIEAIASVLLIIAIFYIQKIYQMTKKTTDIWLLMSFVVFTAFLISLSNVLRWYYSYETFHGISEYLRNIYSLAWIYIAYRFLRLKKREVTH